MKPDKAFVAQNHALDFVVSKPAAAVDVDVDTLDERLASDSSHATGERRHDAIPHAGVEVWSQCRLIILQGSRAVKTNGRGSRKCKQTTVITPGLHLPRVYDTAYWRVFCRQQFRNLHLGGERDTGVQGVIQDDISSDV